MAADMQFGVTDTVDPADLARAQAAVETVRPLLGTDPAALVIEAGGERVTLGTEQVRSLVKLVDSVAASSPVAIRDPNDLTLDDAARLMSLPRSVFDRLIGLGHLTPRIIAGEPCLPWAEVLAYIDRQARTRDEALRDLVRFTEEFGI